MPLAESRERNVGETNRIFDQLAAELETLETQILSYKGEFDKRNHAEPQEKRIAAWYALIRHDDIFAAMLQRHREIMNILFPHREKQWEA